MVKININIRKDIDLVKDSMDQFIEEVISRNRIFLVRSDRGWVPAVDVYEIEEEVIALVELPGINTDELTIILGNKHLKICGVRQDIAHKQKIHQMEIDFGKFERIIKLPVAVTEDGSSALYSDGFLIVRLPKE